jgi:hypothetical protein
VFETLLEGSLVSSPLRFNVLSVFLVSESVSVCTCILHCAFPVELSFPAGRSERKERSVTQALEPILRPHVHSIIFPFTHDSVIDALALYDFEVDLHLRSLASPSTPHGQAMQLPQHR